MKFTCVECFDDQEKGKANKCQGIESVDECPRNLVPKLNRNNLEFWNFFSNSLATVLFDGNGGINCGNIDTVLTWHNYSPDGKIYIYDKCLIIAQAKKAADQERLDKIHAKHKTRPRGQR